MIDDHFQIKIAVLWSMILSPSKPAATKTPMYSFYLGLKIDDLAEVKTRGAEAPRKLLRKGSQNQGSRKRGGTRKAFLATLLISTKDMFAEVLQK